MNFSRWVAAFVAVLLASCGLAQAQGGSIYTERPIDPHAVFADAAEFGARGDGVADDTAALQAAIDRVQETIHHGIVFLPAGRYRLTHTLHVWAGIRLIGFGASRPVLEVAPHTPYFAAGPGRYMLWFTDERPMTHPGFWQPAVQPAPVASAPQLAPVDASEFTFFSAVSNVDFAIGAGNPAAVAVRFNVAQHSFVAHADFRLGGARAAIEQVGNQASDIHVHGGQYGIVTGKTSPAWQFLLMDSSFDGQTTASIQTTEAGMTLVRDRFEDAPVAVTIPDGAVEQLYGRDLLMRNLRDEVLHVGDVHNLRSEITLEHVHCEGVRRFVSGVERVQGGDPAGWTKAERFTEERFTLGLEIGPGGQERGIVLHHNERSGTGTLPASDIPVLPPMAAWANVRDLGAKGDGDSDDTAALQRAVDTHRALYFPSGMYRLSGSLRLRPDTVLIGLHPFATELVLKDRDPAYASDGAAMPLVLTPPGGRNIVTGIGIATGNANPRAAGVEWQAGVGSMLEDVDFIRGHSEYVPALEPAAPRPNWRQPMDLNAQYPSLWVHNGGGGVLRGIWSHAGTAHAGLEIEDTDTPGVVYQFSCEHHMRVEVEMRHVRHWAIFDLQTEEENPEGAGAYALHLNDVHDLLLANPYMYRVSRNVRPMPFAVIAQDSDDVRFAGIKVFSQTRLAFDNSVHDDTNGVTVRARHFAGFTLRADAHPAPPPPVPAVFASGAQLRRVGTGFSNADGLTAGTQGEAYFSDAVAHHIYRIAPPVDARGAVQADSARLLADLPGSPMVLAFVPPGTLMSVNADKTVTAVDTATGTATAVSGAATKQPGTVLLLPVGLHNELVQLDWLLGHVGYTYRQGSNTALRSGLEPQERLYFYAPEEQGHAPAAILAGGTWRPLLQSSQMAMFPEGASHLLTSEDDARTWQATLGPGEHLAAKLFTERGGTSVVRDSAGNVYLASDQVYVYDAQGRQTGTLAVPQRPGSLCFGGKDGRTLFVTARDSVYAIRTLASGR